MVRMARVTLGTGARFDRSGRHNVSFVFVEKHNRASSFLIIITKEKKLVITFPSAKLIIQGEHDLCTFPLLHTVAIPATIENATRLKRRNYVLLSTEGCRDQTAPFSFSLLFPFIILDSVFKEQGDPTSKGTFFLHYTTQGP